MKVRYRMANVEFEHEVSTRKDAFQFVSDMSDLFPDEPCGCCKSKSTRPRVRKHQSYLFYEIVCNDCTAQLSFGQAKEGGGLFLKRWDKENQRVLPNNGWSVYKKEAGQKPAYSGDRPQGREPDLPVNEDSREPGGEVPF